MAALKEDLVGVASLHAGKGPEVIGDEPLGDRMAEAERKMLKAALNTYQTTEERAALRCALGDAAALADTLALQIENENRTARGHVTKHGRALAAAVRRAGDDIWAMREKIDVRPPATNAEDSGSTEPATGATS
jgi:hypothetical protein